MDRLKFINQTIVEMQTGVLLSYVMLYYCIANVNLHQ